MYTANYRDFDDYYMPPDYSVYDPATENSESHFIDDPPITYKYEYCQKNFLLRNKIYTYQRTSKDSKTNTDILEKSSQTTAIIKSQTVKIKSKTGNQVVSGYIFRK